MEFHKESLQMLEQFDKPAFFADKATVLISNSHANAIGICEGTKLSELFDKKTEEDFSNVLFTATVTRIEYTVSAAQVGEATLYTLTASSLTQQLQGIMHAAQQLRIPLSSLSSSVSLLNQDDPQCGKIRKHLHSLQRAIRNMSDATLFLEDRSAKKETVEIGSYVAEIAQKLQQHFSDSDICIDYSVFEEKLYCDADMALVERALYNMVSNSLKAGSQKIQLDLKRKDQSLYLTVTDDGCGMTGEEKSEILSQFRKQPGWISNGYGLGLGMMIIYAAAKAHNGTFLINDNEPHGCKITLTIEIKKGNGVLRQKPASLYVDPLGGADTLLLELSDVLPNKDYL